MRPSNQKTFSILVFIRNRNSIPNQRSIYLRITVNSRSVELSLNTKIDIDKWDERRKCTKGNSQSAVQAQIIIDNAKADLLEIYRELKYDSTVIDAATVKNRYLRIDTPNNSLLKLFAYHEEHHFPKVKEGTRKHFRTLYKYSKEFLKVDLKVNDIYLTSLSYSYLVKFENFLLSKRCPSKVIMKRKSAVKHIQSSETIEQKIDTKTDYIRDKRLFGEFSFVSFGVSFCIDFL